MPSRLLGLCSGGLEKLLLRSFPPPLLQNNSHVQVLSAHLFCEVMDLAVDKGEKPLERIVSQSLLPLFLHCHEENQHVAKVRFCVMLVDPWQGGSAASCPGTSRAAASSSLGTETRLLHPELRCHLHTSAALQAFWNTLHCAAGFLNKTHLQQVLNTEELWKFAECLVRTAWKSQARPGEAP